MKMSLSDRIKQSGKTLANGVSQLSFSEPVHLVYNPLEYAWDIHQQYLELASQGKKKGGFFGNESRTLWDGPDGGSIW